MNKWCSGVVAAVAMLAAAAAVVASALKFAEVKHVVVQRRDARLAGIGSESKSREFD